MTTTEVQQLWNEACHAWHACNMHFEWLVYRCNEHDQLHDQGTTSWVWRRATSDCQNQQNSGSTDDAWYV